MADEQRLRELEERYEGYTVYDNEGSRIGKVDDLFIDEGNREEYLGVKMGLFGLSGTTLIPMDVVRVDDNERAIEVAESKDRVKEAPTYRDDDDIDAEFEARIREHYGLEGSSPSAGRGTYGSYADTGGRSDRDNTMVGDRMQGDRGDTGEHSGRPMGGAQNPETYDERDREREPLGQESYQNREGMSEGSATGAAAGSRGGGEGPTGGVGDLDTTDRGRTGDNPFRDEGGRGQQDAYRQEVDLGEAGGSGATTGTGASGGMTRGHREEPGERPAARTSEGGYDETGLRAGDQGYQETTSPGRTGGMQGEGGTRGEAERYLGGRTGEPGDKEFDDTQDYQSSTTGYRPDRSGQQQEEGGMTGGGVGMSGGEGTSGGGETGGREGQQFRGEVSAEGLDVGNLPVSSADEVERDAMGGQAGEEGSRGGGQAGYGESGGEQQRESTGTRVRRRVRRATE